MNTIDEAKERKAFNNWMVNVAKIIIGSSDPYPAGLERDYWEVWLAAKRHARAEFLAMVPDEFISEDAPANARKLTSAYAWSVGSRDFRNELLRRIGE